MATSPASASGSPTNTWTSQDPVFGVMRWVGIALLAFTLYYAVMDAVQQNWLSFITSAVLTMLMLTVIVLPSFRLAKAEVSIDSEGITRTGAWSVPWDQVGSATTQAVKDLPYLTVVPKNPSRSTDLTRFFLFRSGLPREALVAPIPRASEGDVRDALKRKGR